MNELSAINPRTLIPSKENIKSIAESIIVSVLDGELDALEMCTKLAAIEKICEQVREGISKQVLHDLDKFPKGETIVFDATIARKEVGVKYDFTLTPAWVELKAKEEAIAEQRKKLEGMLKTIPKAITDVDQETGETIEYIPAAKSSKTSFSITLAK